MQHDHYSKGEVLEIFVSYFFTYCLFRINHCTRPLLNCGSRSVQKILRSKIRGFFCPNFLPGPGEPEQAFEQDRNSEFFYFYPFHSYQVASIIIFTDVGAYNSQKPTWPRFCSKSQSSLASSSSNFFDKHHKNFLSLREPNPSHILTHQKSPSHRSR